MGANKRTDAYTLPFGKCPKEPEETDNQPSQGRCRRLGQRPPFKGPAPSPLFTPAMCRKRASRSPHLPSSCPSTE